MSGGLKYRCLQDEPDCEHCPYPDCIATFNDINRQNRVQKEKERIARNARIVELWEGGMDKSDIAELVGEPFSTVTGVIQTERKRGNVKRSTRKLKGAE